MNVTWESDGLWIWKMLMIAGWTVAVGEDPRSISSLVRAYRKLLKLYAYDDCVVSWEVSEDGDKGRGSELLSILHPSS